MSWEFYFKPIVARGAAEKRPGTAGSLAAGSTDIPVDSATSYFSVGDPIFVTDSNEENISFCGLANAVDADSVTVNLPTRIEYSTGTPAYYVITPSDFVIFGSDYRRMEKVRNLGVRNFSASGGVLYRTQTGDATVIFRFVFMDQEMSSWKDVEDFIVDVLFNGLNDFTMAFWDDTDLSQVVLHVRMTQGETEFNTKPSQLGDRVFEVFRVGEDYV